MNQTIHDLQVIDQYREGDRFAVQNNRLILDKQGVWQGLARTVKNLRFGGYNRNDVTNYMEGLAARIEKLPQEQLKQNANQLIRLESAVGHIQCIYRPELFSFQSKGPSERMSKISDRLAKVTKELKYSPSPETDFNQLYVYDPAFPPFYKPPKEITPARIVQLSKELYSRKEKLITKIAKRILIGIAFILLSPLLGFMSGLKICVWNPIELFCRREIRTRSPISWATNVWVENFLKNQFDKRKMETYASWLFHAKEVTDAHIEAVGKLPWIGNKLDFSLFSLEVKDLDELKLALKDLNCTNTLDSIENDKELQNRLKQSFEGKRVDLRQFLDKNRVPCPLKEYSKCGKLIFDEIQGEAVKSLSYKHFKRAIELAAKHKELKEINLPLLYDQELDESLQFLQQEGFRFVFGKGMR